MLKDNVFNIITPHHWKIVQIQWIMELNAHFQTLQNFWKTDCSTWSCVNLKFKMINISAFKILTFNTTQLYVPWFIFHDFYSIWKCVSSSIISSIMRLISSQLNYSESFRTLRVHIYYSPQPDLPRWVLILENPDLSFSPICPTSGLTWLTLPA